MTSPLLSSYRTGENRVTASTVAVFERVGLPLTGELLEAATQAGADLVHVSFENQVTAGESLPDARIGAHFDWWFETKTERGAYDAEGRGRAQLRRHARLLAGVADGWLFVLTPDPVRPAWFDVLDGVDPGVHDRVLWAGFRDLAEAARVVLADPTRTVGERNRFLLDELGALYEAEGLTTNHDTVVVAARAAWPEYMSHGAYVCQANRSFRKGLTHLGFYTSGAVQPMVPAIRRHVPAVPWTPAQATAYRAAGDVWLADLVDALLADGSREEGRALDVFELSPPGDPDTLTLAAPVANDTRTASGRPWAWTLGQRYASLDRLAAAKVTSDI